jgi:hypothetical protein
MNIQKKVLCVLAFVAVAGFATTSWPSQNTAAFKGDVNDGVRGEQWPVVDYEAPEPGEVRERGRRLKRDKRFNKSLWSIRPPASNRETTTVDYLAPIPALPVAGSQVVVLGVVTEARAYLSEDRSGVYSEFSIRVGEVLKNDTGLSWPAGAQVTATRLGGRVRSRSGHVHLYRIAEHSAPKVGDRYVFFLEGTDEEDNFLLLTAYELREGKAHPLDRWPHAARYADVDESRLLADIRAAIQGSPQPLPN